MVGSIANFIAPYRSGGGWIGSIVLGVVGALVGGWLGNVVFGVGVTGFNLPSLIVTLVGALIVLGVTRLLFRAVR